MMQSPFKFLDSYTREDRAIFFGREHETEEMYRKVFESKILLFYGISGTGKTSLINCGLANKFDDSDWLPVQVRRGKNLLESLINELGKVAMTPLSVSPLKGGDVVRVLRSVYLDHFKPIYLIFDQFEELFIFGDREERKQFIQIVKEIITADVQCRLIFSIREEYLAGVTEFEELLPDFMSNRMRVEKMTRQHAVKVIKGPCEVQGIAVEEGFAEALLEKLNPSSNEVELTFLQVFLDKLVKIIVKNAPLSQEESGGKFTHALLGQVGDVSDLLGSFLEEQISKMKDPEAALSLLKSFVSTRGTKKQVTGEEAMEFSRSLGKKLDASEVKEYINQFVDLRILKEKDDNQKYELRHDSLAATIYRKITLVEKEIMEVRLFIENAYNNYLVRKVLLNEEDLKYIASYEDVLFLGNEHQAFMELSKSEIHSRRRAIKRISMFSTIGFVIVVAGVGIYYVNRMADTKTSDLTVFAGYQLQSAPLLSLQTAFEAYQRDSLTTRSRIAIFNAFYALWDQYPEGKERVFNFTPCNADIVSANFSPDGKYIYGWTSMNEIKLWSAEGKELMSVALGEDAITLMRMSADNQFLGVLTAGRKLHVYTPDGREQFTVETDTCIINNKYRFDFSGRDEFLLATARGNEVILYTREGEEYQRLVRHSGKVNALAISPDNQFMVTAGSDHMGYIWHFRPEGKKYVLFDSITGHTKAIWSCAFNNRSNYILTASADSSFSLWNLHGERTELGSYFSYIGKSSTFGAEGFNTYYAFTRGKRCDAWFSADNKCIAVTLYLPGTGNAKYEFRHFLLHDRSSDFIKKGTHEAIDRYGVKNQVDQVLDYDYLVPSPDDRYIATVVRGTQVTNLIIPGGIQIGKFTGIQPVFSPDGKYLLCKDKNTLCTYVVDIDEIRKLVFKDLIFGEIKPELREWITY
jgi:WD40 repeat protein